MCEGSKGRRNILTTWVKLSEGSKIFYKKRWLGHGADEGLISSNVFISFADGRKGRASNSKNEQMQTCPLMLHFCCFFQFSLLLITVCARALPRSITCGRALALGAAHTFSASRSLPQRVYTLNSWDRRKAGLLFPFYRLGTEAQRDEVTSPRGKPESVAELGNEPRDLDSHLRAFQPQ